MQVINHGGRTLTNTPSGFSGNSGWSGMAGQSGASGRSGYSGFSGGSSPGGLVGVGCTQTGTDSNAGGFSAAALGDESLACGFKPIAAGKASISLGTGVGLASFTGDVDQGDALGDNSLCAGNLCNAFGNQSVALGNTCASYSDNSFSCGLYGLAGNSGEAFTTSGTLVTIAGNVTAEYSSGDAAICYGLTGGSNHTLFWARVTLTSTPVFSAGPNHTTFNVSTPLDDRTGGTIADCTKYSGAFCGGGYSNIAYAQNSMTLAGYSNETDGVNSVAGGYGCDPQGAQSFAFGQNCGTEPSATASIALGFQCTTGLNGAGGYAAFAAGFVNVAKGKGSASLAGGFCSALGDYSFCGGHLAIASGTQSFAFGSYCNARGDESVAMGANCNALNTASIAMGQSKVAGSASAGVGSATVVGDFAFGTGASTNSGAYSLSSGNSTRVGNLPRAFTVSGTTVTIAGDATKDFPNGTTARFYLLTGGTANTLFVADRVTSAVSFSTNTTFTISGVLSDRTGGVCVLASGVADYAMATGQQSLAYHNGQIAHSTGQFSRIGDAQVSRLVMTANTTNATSTEMLLSGVANDRLTIPDSTAWAYEIQVMARTSAGSAVCAAYFLRGFVNRDTGVANTRILTTGTVTVNDAGAAAWSVTASADTTNGALKVAVIGAAATNIHWVGEVRLSESGW